MIPTGSSSHVIWRNKRLGLPHSTNLEKGPCGSGTQISEEELLILWSLKLVKLRPISEERCCLADVSTSVGALRDLYETSSGNPKKTKQKTAGARSFVETILTAMTRNSKAQVFLPLPCFPISIPCFFCQNPSARKLVGKEEI